MLYFIDLLFKDGVINDFEDIPKIIRQRHFKKYKLTTFLKYGVYNLFNMVCPNKWYKWDFCSVGNSFWTEKNNLKDLYNWLLNKLNEDKLIYCLDDILGLDQSIFTRYNLNGMLAGTFNYSPFNFWNYFNPGVWFEWEFKNTPKNYWSNYNNRKNALKQLCEIKLSLKVDEIPNYISYPFLVKYYHKFSLICDQYYNSNIFKWVDECYPYIFRQSDFKHIISIDGTKLDSIDEKIIHEFLINNFKKVKYYDNNTNNDNKWVNYNTNEKYVADWLVNNNIIVEYFGWYNMFSYNKNKIFTDYINKANRKIEYYSNLSNYNFIALYPYDLNSSLLGVKEKFFPYMN
jgi:hypothetical protein